MLLSQISKYRGVFELRNEEWFMVVVEDVFSIVIFPPLVLVLQATTMNGIR